MENTATLQVRITHVLCTQPCPCSSRTLGGFAVKYYYVCLTLMFLCPGAVLVFLPGLAEIKMLYEQLQSNRMFNNRGATRSVSKGMCVFLQQLQFFLLFCISVKFIFYSCFLLTNSWSKGKNMDIGSFGNYTMLCLNLTTVHRA